MFDDPFKYVLLAALAIALVVAAFTDFRSRTIYNWLNAAIALGVLGLGAMTLFRLKSERR